VENCSDFTDDLASYSEIECSSVKAETLSEIVFTSGTTGQAKGVALTHKQVLTATMHIITQVRNNYSDIELLLMPLSHSFGMARMRTTLFARGTLVLGYPLQRLKNVFKAIELYKVTGLGLVPSGWKFIIQMSKDMIVKYSHQLKYIEFGSAALAPEDKLLVTEWFPQTHIVMHYGLTEVSRALFTHLHSDNHVAVGNLSRGAEVVILSEEDAILRVGEIGEIALKAKWMCTGYHDDSKLTKNSFVNGFLKTGDQGYVKGNHLFLTGRIREIINVGGKKVSPYRIEELMNDFDFVKESACAGYPDDQMGEVVHAYIVLNPKIEIMEDDVTSQLEKLIATKLPVYMRPSGYHYLESLPKTLTGKIQRGNLLQN
jgi:acyl-CoA synthetase (AMP-forming)/AMP-acid ligase II